MPLGLLRAGARLPAAASRRASTINVPFVSDTIPLAEGVLGEVESLLAAVGDSVEPSTVVAVIETDKVALDIKARTTGKIARVLVSEGEVVKERQPLFELAE